LQLLSFQLDKIDILNSHRKGIANIYNANLKKCFRFKKHCIFLRFPIQISNSEEIKGILQKKGIILGNWYNNPIYPEGVDLNLFNYKQDCPIAENKCKYILNLPTNIEVTREVAKYIADVINKYGKSI
jgi:dTDP-4-amino-4,6-dideoxygalactose transaminase